MNVNECANQRLRIQTIIVMTILCLIEGNDSRPTSRREAAACAKSTVHLAIAKGYVVGKRVLIGNVQGTVIGYNIANGGEYPSGSYPLVVATDYGVSKCTLAETRLWRLFQCG